MVDAMAWQTLAELELGALGDYADDWKTTKKSIKEHAEDLSNVVKGLKDNAFGDALDNAYYSPGAQAAIGQGEDLRDRMDAAREEGAAVYDTVDWAHSELKSVKSRFNKRVEEINDTSTDFEGSGNFSVDLAGETVAIPAAPSGERWGHAHTLQEWDNAYRPKAEEFAQELNDIALEAAEIDADAANYLANNSTNKDDFNADPDPQTPSVIEAEEDAEETADLLSGGEDGIVSEEELDKANELMAEHEGEPAFSTTLMESLGAKGLLTETGQIAYTTNPDGTPRDKSDMDALYENLGNHLATATDPDNEPHVDDEWVDELMKEGGQPQAIPDPENPDSPGGWNTYGYQMLSPILGHGKYDPDFVVPITEHMMTLDQEGAAWHLSDIPPNVDPLLGGNPVNGALVACDNNPDAATELFSQNGKDKYPGLDGEPVEQPDPLDYVFDNAVDTDDGGYTAIDADLAGNAIEAATTGLSSGQSLGEVDERPVHTQAMADITERVFDYVVDNPDRFTDQEKLGGMVDNLGDITASYAEDFYRAYLNESAADDDWVPKSHGVELDLGFYDPKVGESSKVDDWMHVLGHHQGAYGTALGATSAVAEQAIAAGAMDPDESSRGLNMSSAASGLGRIVGELTEGELVAVRENSSLASEKELKTAINDAAAYVVGKLPVVGDEAGYLTGKLLNWASGVHDDGLEQALLEEQQDVAADRESKLEKELRESIEAAAEKGGVDADNVDEILQQMTNEFTNVIDLKK